MGKNDESPPDDPGTDHKSYKFRHQTFEPTISPKSHPPLRSKPPSPASCLPFFMPVRGSGEEFSGSWCRGSSAFRSCSFHICTSIDDNPELPLANLTRTPQEVCATSRLQLKSSRALVKAHYRIWTRPRRSGRRRTRGSRSGAPGPRGHATSAGPRRTSAMSCIHARIARVRHSSGRRKTPRRKERENPSKCLAHSAHGGVPRSRRGMRLQRPGHVEEALYPRVRHT